MRTHLSNDTTFRHTRFRAGYATDEVDLFVQAVQDALRSHRPRVGATEVAYQRFTPVVLRPGYRMDDVEDYLTEARHLLDEREQRTEGP